MQAHPVALDFLQPQHAILDCCTELGYKHLSYKFMENVGESK